MILPFPTARPCPGPDLRMIQRPIGPVAVFGASNFPLAFSVAGGDTAAALAAGCPVVVKGHSAHPGTGELVAQAIDAAIKALQLHPGHLLFGAGRKNVMWGTRLVQHPLIRAGRLHRQSERRARFVRPLRGTPRPHPVFRRAGIRQSDVPAAPPRWPPAPPRSEPPGLRPSRWVQGQFCTNPGIALVLDGPDADRFQSATIEALEQVGGQTMAYRWDR